MKETFRSRFGLIMALVGMAVGTGNIWRFPRIMSQNGGGAFLIPWAIFLLLWSVPLLTVEFSMGKKLRKGVVGCFQHLSNGTLTWLGAFVVCCTLGIMFYYSVVTGWCLFYFIHSITGQVVHYEAKPFWDSFSHSRLLPLILHAIVVGMSGFIVARGVQDGIERASRILIPSLFIILFGLACYSLTLSGASRGVGFIFNFDLSRLSDYKVWLEALTQSAWSTGAGWGLALTYSCYARKEDHPVRTPMITGISNNCVEILAVLVILPTLFTFFPFDQALALTAEGNTGLTFIALPGLFQQMEYGQIVAIFFFMALFFAAFTSLIAMFELGTSFLGELGLSRSSAVHLLCLVAVVLGAPSALNMTFFDNQDWVWGIGLLVSGFFFTILVRCVGAERFADEFVGIKSPSGRWCMKFLITWVIPFEFLALVSWWFAQSVGWDPAGWWHPFHAFSIGTCLWQWGAVLAVLFFLNRRISARVRS